MAYTYNQSMMPSSVQYARAAGRPHEFLHLYSNQAHHHLIPTFSHLRSIFGFIHSLLHVDIVCGWGGWRIPFLLYTSSVTKLALLLDSNNDTTRSLHFASFFQFPPSQFEVFFRRQPLYLIQSFAYNHLEGEL